MIPSRQMAGKVNPLVDWATSSHAIAQNKLSPQANVAAIRRWRRTHASPATLPTTLKGQPACCAAQRTGLPRLPQRRLQHHARASERLRRVCFRQRPATLFRPRPISMTRPRQRSSTTIVMPPASTATAATDRLRSQPSLRRLWSACRNETLPESAPPTE